MKCDIEICGRPARFIYTATVSKRQICACEYHIAPFRYYVNFGATVEPISEVQESTLAKSCSLRKPKAEED